MFRVPVRLRRYEELPGPAGWPLLGNALQIQAERMHLIAERWARRYGEAYRFRLGPRRIVVISNPEVVAGVLRDRPEGFARAARLCETAAELGFSGLFTANGEAWRRQRPMVLGGLDPAHIRAFFPTLVKVTRRFQQRWQRAADCATPIDLQADLMRYTVDVTAGLALGTDINTLESDEEIIQRHLDVIFPALSKRLLAMFPYWRYFTLPSDRRLRAHLQALRTAIDGFIAAARGRLAACPRLREDPDNLIEAMLAERDRPGSLLTDADVSGNVLTMLLAGEDTTANTLAWLIWLLQANPEAAQRARYEVRALLGSESVCANLESLQGLEFVEACIHEAMRIKPVAPILVLQAARPSVVGDVALPAGALVMCLMRPGAVDSRHFAQAQSFLPERWLHGAGPSPAAARRVAMPFGAGPRLCPGRYLALAEMKMVAAMLFSAFEIERVDAPGGGDARECLSFTMSPVGLRMVLKSRR